MKMRRAWWLRVLEVLCRFSPLQDLKASEERSTSGLQDNAKAELALGTPVFRANPYLHMLQVIPWVLVSRQLAHGATGAQLLSR